MQFTNFIVEKKDDEEMNDDVFYESLEVFLLFTISNFQLYQSSF